MDYKTNDKYILIKIGYSGDNEARNDSLCIPHTDFRVLLCAADNYVFIEM